MAEPDEWNDASREEFRERVRRTIRGELRLSRYAREELIETCVVESIEEEAPEGEAEELQAFAEAYLWEAAAELDAEREGWPETTDVDRLDRAEAMLQEKGILFWQVSPCCDNCTLAELGERIGEVEEDDPDFPDRVRGYAFYIDQSLPDSLADGSRIELCIGYGWLAAGEIEVPEEEQGPLCLGIGREVFDALKQVGFEPEWDGNLDKKIQVAVDWKCR